MLPDVAVTVIMYVPAGVPVTGGGVVELEPPPQPTISVAAVMGISTRHAESATRAKRRRLAGLCVAASKVAINSSMASAENGNIRIAAGGCILVAGSDCGDSMPRAVVATVTLTAAGVFAVSAVLAGALQVAAVGAPVQAKVTVAFWLALICSM